MFIFAIKTHIDDNIHNITLFYVFMGGNKGAPNITNLHRQKRKQKQLAN
jgi:hypothetical protein